MPATSIRSARSPIPACCACLRLAARMPSETSEAPIPKMKATVAIQVGGIASVDWPTMPSRITPAIA